MEGIRMDEEMMRQMRSALLERWKRTGKSVASEMEANADMIANQQAEIIDIAQNLEQIDRDASLAEQERRELLAIERALSKMATGSFGICEDCGEAIPSKRLLVLPEARLCAHCQAFEERQNARLRPPGAVAR
jgi:DnaK suppressor protein